MTVRRIKDQRTAKVFLHKTADIPGGVAVVASELGGDYIREGAVLSTATDGKRHVVKVARVVAQVAEADKEIKVAKFGNFKVGDAVMAAKGGKAVAITAIDYANKSYDVITLGEALGAIDVNAFIAEAAKAATTGAALKYAPEAINGTGQVFSPKSNINTDAIVIGVTTNNELPDYIAEKLPTIRNI